MGKLLGIKQFCEYVQTVKNALNLKVDKVTGKGLSTNDYTTAEQDKLAGIEAGAEKNRTYTAFTGKPTANQTPSFGDTFTLQQIKQATTGQVSGTDRTVTIPDTEASTTTHGLMSASDKAKLDGIAEGAQVNPTYTPFTGTPTGNQTPGFGDTFTVQQISQTATGQVGGTDRTVTIPDAEASTTAHGLMSSADKTKLNSIASGAEENVQSDWSQADTTADDYIKNKPTIPTKTSDLTNDSGFITSSSTVFVKKTGDTMTGGLTLNYANPNIAEKGTISMRIGAAALSSNARVGGLSHVDSNGDTVFYSESYRTTSNDTYTSFVHRRYNASNSTWYYNGFYLYVNNSGTPTVGFSNNTVRDAWATALNVVKKTGDTMTGVLNINTASGNNLVQKFTNVEARVGQTAPSSNVYWDKSWVVDRNGRLVHFEEGAWRTDNSYSISYGLRRFNAAATSNWTNSFTLAIDNSGNSSVSVSHAAAWRSAIGAVNRAGDTLTANFTLSASDTTGRWIKVKNSGHEGSLYADTAGNLGVWSDTKGKWVVRCNASTGQVLLNGGWTQIAQVQGTNSATYTSSSYTELLLMIWNSTSYMGTTIIPLSAIGATQYEVYTGGWGNNATNSNRAGCALVSNAKLTGVMVRSNNYDVTASSYFRLYAR